MTIAEHKLSLFRQIDQMPEELIFEVEQFISKLRFKKTIDSNDQLDLTGLESFLKPRIEAAEQGKVINKSVTQIFAEVHEEEML
jgi:Antitoxin ParD